MIKNHGLIAVSFLQEILECLDSDGEYMERFIRMMMEYGDLTRKDVRDLIQEYRNTIESYEAEKI